MRGTTSYLPALAAVLLTIVGMLSSACQSTAGPTTAVPTTAMPAVTVTIRPSITATPSATPAVVVRTPAYEPTGEFKVGVESFLDEPTDPIKGSWSGASQLLAPVFDTLVDIETDGRPSPGIAAAWQASDDYKTWTLNIRKDVKFHDGNNLAGADVKFSLERFASKDSASTFSGYFRKALRSVELRDTYTVVVNLNNSDPEFLYRISPAGGSEGMVMPKKYIEEKGIDAFNKQPVGSGPFRQVKTTRGVSYEYEAFYQHWREVPRFKRMTILLVPDETSRKSMLKAGGLDIAEVSLSSVDELTSGGFRMLSIPDSYAAYIPLWATHLPANAGNPTSDVRVRQALGMTIDKDQIVRGVFRGFARQAGAAFVFPNEYFFDSSVLQPIPYDLEKAKGLLTQAGYAKGFSIKLYTFALPGSPWLPSLAEAVASSWKKVGVNAQIVTMDFGAFKNLQMPELKPEIVGQASTSRSSTTPYYMLGEIYHSRSSLKLADPGVADAMIERVEGTVNWPDRTRLATESARMLNDQYVTLPIAYVDTLYAVGSNIGGWTPLPGNPQAGYNWKTVTHRK